MRKFPSAGLAVAAALLLTTVALGVPAASGAGSVALLKSVWYPDSFVNVNGSVFFEGGEGTASGSELWKSDGTTAGTALVKDIYPGEIGSSPGDLTNVAGTLFFTASDGTHGIELWKSDGTAAGTVRVSIREPRYITAVGSTAYFTVDDGTHGRELWKSTGAPGGTSLIKDIYPGSLGSDPFDLTDVNGVLYFAADDYVHGEELWRSDGTAAGTKLVKDIDPGSRTSDPSDLTNVNGKLYFAALETNDVPAKDALWTSDGTVAGTKVVKVFSGGLEGFMSFNGKLFFWGNDATNHGYQLWKSNGSASGTVLVKDIAPPPNLASETTFAVAGSTLYIAATDATHGTELWKSNGAATGTVLVKDINPGGDADPIEVAPVGSKVVFMAYDANHGYEPWKSNGTAAGTILMDDLRPGINSSLASGYDPLYVVLGGYYLFSATDGSHPDYLYRAIP